MTIAKKNLLGGLMLALVLGLGLRVVETPVRAAETTAVAHSSDTAGAAQAQENDKEVDENDAYRHSRFGALDRREAGDGRESFGECV